MADNPGQYAPHVYKSWASVMRAVNHEWPSSVHRVNIAQRRVLQQLVHKRRMR